MQSKTDTNSIENVNTDGEMKRITSIPTIITTLTLKSTIEMLLVMKTTVTEKDNTRNNNRDLAYIFIIKTINYDQCVILWLLIVAQKPIV